MNGVSLLPNLLALDDRRGRLSGQVPRLLFKSALRFVNSGIGADQANKSLGGREPSLVSEAGTSLGTRAVPGKLISFGRHTGARCCS